MQAVAQSRISSLAPAGSHRRLHAFKQCRTAKIPSTCYRAQPRRSLCISNSAIYLKDDASGAEWHVGQKFWIGESMRCLGAGTRAKQVLFFNAKVYSIALYVEGDKCAKELGIRDRGGFFETDDDYAQAVLDGAFSKALVIRLLRDVDGPTFSQAIQESLEPRLALTGDLPALAKFVEFFESKQLTTGTEIALLWPIVNDLQITLRDNTVDNYSTFEPDVFVESNTMSRALFEIYLGSSTVTPGARAAWVQGIKNLLDYDKVRRGTKKQV